jgi:hypothetical protein
MGRYRLLDASDQFLGLVCQTRQEFYFLHPSSDNVPPTYLGTCGSPGFVADPLHMPADPSCFAISENGESMVYLHSPEICGAGAKAREKPGGIYVHSVAQGDRLVYRDFEVNQVWGGKDVGRGAMRATWLGKAASRAGALCDQTIVIHADGREDVEGQPNPDSPLCHMGSRMKNGFADDPRTTHSAAAGSVVLLGILRAKRGRAPVSPDRFEPTRMHPRDAVTRPPQGAPQIAQSRVGTARAS